MSDTPGIPMLLHCPLCNARHIDAGEFATTKHHHTHACQSCGHVWRPAIINTVGVQFLPGFQDAAVVNNGCSLQACRELGAEDPCVLPLDHGGRCIPNSRLYTKRRPDGSI